MERQVKSGILCFCLVFLVFASLSAGAESSKSTQTDPPSKKCINWEKLEVVDYLRAGALVFAFAFACFWDPSCWTTFDAVMSLGSGLALYFFPAALLSYQTTSKLDHVHLYMAQIAGTCMVAQAVVTHALDLRNNSCVMVKHSWILARVVAIPVLLMIHIHLHFIQKIMTDQHVLFGMMASVLWLAGTCLFIFRSMHETSRSRTSMLGEHDCITMHLCVQLLMLMPLFGALMFPETLVNMSVKNADVLHFNQHRMIGGMMLIPFFMNLLGLFYSNDRDKKALLKGQITVFAMFVPLVLLHQWRYTLLTRGMFLFALGYQGAAFGNAYVGVYGSPICKFKRN